MASSFPKIICRVRAIYPFYSEEPASLNFNKDDCIDVLAQLDSGWWDGWCGGSRGWFPSNYVEVIEENNSETTVANKQQRPLAASPTSVRSDPQFQLSQQQQQQQQQQQFRRRPTQRTSKRRSGSGSHRASIRTLGQSNTRHPFSVSPPPSGGTSTSFGWTSSNRMSQASSADSLPDGWSVQVAEDGSTYYYYNHRTGKMQYDHPGHVSDGEYDSQEEYLDGQFATDSYSEEEYYDEYDDDDDFAHDINRKRLSNSRMNRLSIDSLPANVESPETTISDIPGGASSNAMSQWVERVTPQGRIYYCNLTTQETTWDHNDIDKITGRLKNAKDSDSDLDDAPVQPQSRGVNFPDTFDPHDDQADRNAAENAEEPLTWQKLSSGIALAIHHLNTAAQRGERETFVQDASSIVVAIRVMLYASGTLDKESIHMQDRLLRDPHRAVMAALSKLVLSVKTAAEVSQNTMQPEMLYRVQRDAGDVLASVRSFVTVCQEKGIHVEQVKPQLLINPNSHHMTANGNVGQDIVIASNQQQGNNNNDLSGENDKDNRRTSMVDRYNQVLVQKAKYPLNQDLIVSLQTHANQVYGSTDALSKAAAFILTIREEDFNHTDDEDYDDIERIRNSSRARSNVVILFRNLSMQIGQYLSILEDVDLSSVDGTKIPSLADFHVNKQNLYNSVGNLFAAVQTLSSADVNVGQCVGGIDNAVQLVENTIGVIFANVEEMVQQRKNYFKQMEPRDKEVPMSPITSNMPYDDMIPNSSNNTNYNYDQDEFTASSPISKTRKVQLTNRNNDERTQWCLGYDYAPDEIVFGSDGNVKGGTLRALVERLTLHDTLDTSFIATFLLTYRSFCTTEEFLTLLEQRYNLRPSEGLTPCELETWTDQKQKLVRLRVFNVMKSWLENYYNDEDEHILGRLEFFTNTVIRDASSFSADQLNRLIRKRKELDANGGLKKLVPNTMAAPMPIKPKDITRITLLDIDAMELSRQLTLMDFKLYSSIRPIECLNKAWSREDTEGTVAMNVKQSIDYCNRLTCWVTDSILANEEAKKRVVVIKYWAQVASRCRSTNNYNTCMAIISAFDNSAIGRLKKTWDLVGNRTIQSLGNIRKLMGANRNFTEYREMIHSVNPPCIPFLGIYLQDLTFIEDGNSDLINKSTGLINFAKRQKAAEVIREINQFQSAPYNLATVPELQTFIKQHLESSRDLDNLYERSLQLEPRESAA
ncbi:ras guanine nucleotide exchange factor domain-containing protein [Circinella umbellata]|nr:ras guanine nucleotide exchange factor domain-containing protein [Circinella umbellata]